ncbi:hypothetical protein A3J61_01420 [Candidatus Nomurabacteria bacterium RIFCSPHIGHO2_02_FULL_38_15]|uniref:Uncharacterized protein n=1 Tax=Candidatus Nomurabacteria bacterium RIFCSPHIGHO2_02_FULL_38_15 TaxID=1801752 RepID=A0A1F6VQP7_9BACT|nr:MAG: hypothetical protein A3J61_01420 [Candidatus Nomurabacteria bacterium RIFCSPHIGHO2_02_FULL_38_15]
MNITLTTALLATCSIMLHGVLLYFLLKFPKKVFVTLEKQLLQSTNEHKPGDWLNKNPGETSWLWERLQDRALSKLSNKEKYLFKTIFTWGSLVVVAWSFTVSLFLTPDINHIVDKVFLRNFCLCFAVNFPVLALAYSWHSSNLEHYSALAIEEKLIDDVKDQLEKIEHGEEDELFDKFS